VRRTLALLLAAAVVVASAGCGGGGGRGTSLDWNGFSGGGLVKARPFSWGGTIIYNRDSEPLTEHAPGLDQGAWLGS
jgi:hypothetical protein